MQFNLSRDDVRQYGIKNGYAQLMFVDATDDYIAARCLILNNFFEGFELYSLSIEKFLKALIFLETGKKTNLKKQDLHNPYQLGRELERVTSYNLDVYEDLLNRLYGYFQNRYYDNKDRSRSMSSESLKEFDELFVHLLSRLPIPPEVKFRLAFFAELFEEDSLKYFPHKYFWATSNNEFLNKEISQMREMYFAVRSWLYPKDTNGSGV